jgi:hypothetical protein
MPGLRKARVVGVCFSRKKIQPADHSISSGNQLVRRFSPTRIPPTSPLTWRQISSQFKFSSSLEESSPADGVLEGESAERGTRIVEHVPPGDWYAPNLLQEQDRQTRSATTS